MDLYHLRVLHAESFGATVETEAFAPELYPDGRYAADFHAGVMTPTGKSLFGQLPCFAGQPATRSLNAFVGPNFQLFARNDSVFVWCAWPITADRTAIVFYTTFPKEWHERPDFREKLKVYQDFEKLVASEDNAMVASLQRGLKTAAFRPGLMSSYEVMLHHWIVGYLDRMTGAAG
jgi:phenylpropionate dioxygenase-like ring-hydroxylating dioxygenase large terminal subunit